jgi:hypothetical protein
MVLFNHRYGRAQHSPHREVSGDRRKTQVFKAEIGSLLNRANFLDVIFS